MCVTFFYLPKPNDPINFFIIFNWDENIFRDTLQIHKWIEDKNIIAGKDVLSQGTWKGFNNYT